MFHRDVFVVFHFECLLLERKEHDPTTFPQFSSADSKGEDLKGRDGEDTHTPKNEFILSKLCSRIHVSGGSFSFLYMQ